jgi:hypothetical protein
MTSAIAPSPLLALGKGLLQVTLTALDYSLMNAARCLSAANEDV